ncbi:hypothetical protein Sango_1165900 [Sesamum angolense]|uniref:Reverse transcriptase domain-containing protein n=1 Tax=Sesamum angolense TaxID=2727404 RepID=A0AAE1WVQ8_9LAMI|nr:hypothetical protein Sango_1165900 [Sesamum angolense]
MEEAIIEDKKKGEEKRKSMYTVGESSRLTKRGTGRSFSVGGGNFSRGGSGFRGSIGPTFGELDRVIAEKLLLRIVLSMEATFGTMLGCYTQTCYGTLFEESGTEPVEDYENRGIGRAKSSTHSYISSELASKILVMDLKEFDVILGMDWLAQHRAVVDCYKKEVMIESSGKPKVVFMGDRQVVPVCVISAIEARRLMLEGCEAFLPHVIDAEKVSPTLKEIPVLRDFLEVFPDDLPGLPPHREVDFNLHPTCTLKSTSLCGGKPGKSSGNTLGKSLTTGISPNVGLTFSASITWAKNTSHPSSINRLASIDDITQTGTTCRSPTNTTFGLPEDSIITSFL